jgi:hypothetical protein
MAERHMTDKQILEHIGFSDYEDLATFLRKLNDFVHDTLNENERRVFRHSLKSPKEAAAELDEDVTPERLEEFIRRHAHGKPVACFACKVGGP